MMTTRTRLTCLALVAGLAALVTGCINLKPKPDPTRYYVLEGPADPTPKSHRDCPQTILVGPVRIAGYADQVTVVERRGGHEIVPLNLHRWAEPLAQALPRALTSRLSRDLPDRCVAAYQERTPAEGTIQLEIDVTRFELTDAGEAVVDLRWRTSVFGKERGGQSATATSRQAYEPSDQGIATGIEALSQALDDTVHELAGALGAP